MGCTHMCRQPAPSSGSDFGYLLSNSQLNPFEDPGQKAFTVDQTIRVLYVNKTSIKP